MNEARYLSEDEARKVLDRVLARAVRMNYDAEIGAECLRLNFESLAFPVTLRRPGLAAFQVVFRVTLTTSDTIQVAEMEANLTGWEHRNEGQAAA